MIKPELLIEPLTHIAVVNVAHLSPRPLKEREPTALLSSSEPWKRLHLSLRMVPEEIARVEQLATNTVHNTLSDLTYSLFGELAPWLCSPDSTKKNNRSYRMAAALLLQLAFDEDGVPNEDVLNYLYPPEHTQFLRQPFSSDLTELEVAVLAAKSLGLSNGIAAGLVGVKEPYLNNILRSYRKKRPFVLRDLSTDKQSMFDTGLFVLNGGLRIVNSANQSTIVVHKTTTSQETQYNFARSQ